MVLFAGVTISNAAVKISIIKGISNITQVSTNDLKTSSQEAYFNEVIFRYILHTTCGTTETVDSPTSLSNFGVSAIARIAEVLDCGNFGPITITIYPHSFSEN